MPMAGKDRGFVLIPEVGDEVLVAFEREDLRFPYVLGALWNGKDKPPFANDDGKNDKRMLKSRKKHYLLFDDGTQGRRRARAREGPQGRVRRRRHRRAGREGQHRQGRQQQRRDDDRGQGRSSRSRRATITIEATGTLERQGERRRSRCAARS